MARPSPKADAVVAYLHENGEARLMEIAEGVGDKLDHVSSAMQRLCRKGECEKVRRGVYRLTEGNATTPDAGPAFTPAAIAGLHVRPGRKTVLQTALTNVRGMVRGLEGYYRGRLPERITVELTLARIHMDEALERAKQWEGR